jgi:hypothetical protein
MKAIFAPDTSFFLQFRQPSELPWSELTPAKEVELVVLTAVLRELDNHSHGSNARRRRVAERVLKSVRELVPGQVVVVKEKNPRVYFSEHDAPDPSAIIPTWIDTSKADEAALAEVLEYRATGLAQLELLTADFTQLRLARRAGVAALMPPDSWKLPPEPDPSEKRLAELERQMRLVQGRAPEIRVWPEVADAEVQEIVGKVPRFPPLSPDFMDVALAGVERALPNAVAHRTAAMSYSARMVEKYQRERQAWIDQIRGILTGLHLRLNFQQGLLPLKLCLENTGAAIATGFEVEVDAEGLFGFIDREDHTVERALEPISLPEPPELKSGNEIFLGQVIGLPDHMSHIPFRDYYTPRADSPEFHWVHDEAVGQRIKGTCGQWRRGRRPDSLSLELIVPSDQDLGGKTEVRGCLLIWFTADNLVEQGELSFPVRLQLDWQDTEVAAKELLARKLQVRL